MQLTIELKEFEVHLTTPHSGLIQPEICSVFEIWHASEHEFQVFIHFSIPKASQNILLLVVTRICTLYARLETLMFVRVMSCRIYRLKLGAKFPV